MDLKKLTPKKVANRLPKKLEKFELPEKIESKSDYKKATDIGSQINSARKDVEKYRDFYAKPHYRTYKEIREMFKPFIEDLKEKEKEIKNQMVSWQKEEQKRLDEEQKRIEEEALKNAKPGEEVSVPIVNEDNKTVDGGAGRSQVREKKKWRVVDISKVPVEYLKVNKTKMNKAVREGKEPSGIETYIDKSIAFSR